MKLLQLFVLAIALVVGGLPMASAQEGNSRPLPQGYVGISYSPLDERMADALGVPKEGHVLVQQMEAGSPAETAGIRLGDLIVAVAGRSFKDPDIVKQLLSSSPIGQPVEISVVRGRSKLSFSVIPITRPDEDVLKKPIRPRWFAAAGPVPTDEGPDVPVIGMTIRTLTPDRAQQLGLPRDTRGAILTFVGPASDAAEVGLLPNDVIRGIGNVPVTTAAEAAARLTASTAGGRAALITIQRGADQLAYLGLRGEPVESAFVSAIASPQVTVSAAPGGAVAVTSMTVAAGPRIALIIGNSAYGPQLGGLANPASDARLVAARLKAVGFDVELLMDGDQKAMKRAISRLGERMTTAGRGSTGLFYFAGHGMQSRGQNYLIPVGAAIEREADVDLEAVAADTVLAQMEDAGATTNIVILDACRNTPILRKFRSGVRGLARMEAPNGSFISYSTAPGSVAFDGDGANSPFATALATEFDRPGQPIELTFRNVRRSVLQSTDGAQTPWDSSSLTDTFMFKP